MMCDILKGSIYFKGTETFTINGEHAVSLNFVDFISWGVLDNGPLYCITLCYVLSIRTRSRFSRRHWKLISALIRHDNQDN
jgi:hypothetical protein